MKIELRSHNDQEEDTIEEIDIDQTIKIEAGTANDGIFSFKLKKISVLKIYSVFKNWRFFLTRFSLNLGETNAAIFQQTFNMTDPNPSTMSPSTALVSATGDLFLFCN